MQEDTDLQIDICQGLNDDVATIIPSKRLQELPVTRKDEFLWIDISRRKLGFV
jgi:hypothetical protein